MSTLRFTDAGAWDRIERHLAGATTERFAFALARVLTGGSDGPALLVDGDGVELIGDHEVDHGPVTPVIASPSVAQLLTRAIAERRSLVQFYSHHGPLQVTPGEPAAAAADAMLRLLDDRPFAVVVWAGGAVHAEWFQRGDRSAERGVFRSVTVVGDHFRLLDAGPVDEARFDRQAPILGRPVQATLRQLRVAVVGQSGTGSHVIVQLAHLGVRHLLVLDDAVLDARSLNVVVTAEHADLGLPAALVAQRRVLTIDPGADVEAGRGLTTGRRHPELAGADLVIGCVAHDGARHELNTLAIDTGVPYLDIGTGVDTGADPPALGARVAFVLPGGPCLTCTAELDPTAVASWRRASRRHRSAPSPSVVHLDGLAASTAMTELIAWLSGTRAPALRVDVDVNGDPTRPGVRVSPSVDRTRRADCAACSHIPRSGPADR